MIQRPILFISHSAGRTGAPILLLNFLKWLKTHSDVPFKILLREGGELEGEFRSLAPVMILNDRLRRLLKHVPHYFSTSSILDWADRLALRRRFDRDNIGLIYSNTITNGVILDELSYLNCPVITHVHELEYWIRCHTGLERFNLTKHCTDHYIAVSDAVKANLIRAHDIPQDQIDVIYEYIASYPVDDVSRAAERDKIRNDLGIPREALIVGASGTTDWHKGPDLFIQVAHTVLHQSLDTAIHFVWVGGSNSGWAFRHLRRSIESLGVSRFVHFVGTQLHPLEYFAIFDVFALTSRHDSFPIVMLEAASLNKPIVCFDGSGGAKEFVGDDCGFVVPYLDVSAMAERIVLLLRSQDLRQHSGQRAKEKVQEYDVAMAAPKIWDVIQRFYKP